VPLAVSAKQRVMTPITLKAHFDGQQTFAMTGNTIPIAQLWNGIDIE
jgi:hypothetical protein